jgi:hypothetical protein
MAPAVAPAVVPTAVETPIFTEAGFARASTKALVEPTTIDSAKYSEPIIKAAIGKELVVFIHFTRIAIVEMCFTARH